MFLNGRQWNTLLHFLHSPDCIWSNVRCEEACITRELGNGVSDCEELGKVSECNYFNKLTLRTIYCDSEECYEELDLSH